MAAAGMPRDLQQAPKYKKPLPCEQGLSNI
jgi:hypothetical protein